MSQYENELKRFENAILVRANKEKDAIINEIDQYKKAEYAKTREEILSSTAHNLKQELSDLELDYKTKLSKKTMEYHKDLINKRNELADKVFAEAKNYLINFASTDEYRVSLSNTAENLGKEYSFDGWVMMMMKKDEKIADKIAAAFGNGCSILFSEDFSIGGFVLHNSEKNIIIDQSYSTLLENQRDWFAKNSGLSVTMNERG